MVRHRVRRRIGCECPANARPERICAKPQGSNPMKIQVACSSKLEQLGRLRARIFIAASVSLVGSTAAYAEGSHQFDIINNTDKTVEITKTISRCIESGTSVNWPQTIGPRQTYTVKWDDSNSIYDYDGYGCVNKDKFVAFSVYVHGASNQQYSGYLGITHRRLSGGDWYNGQFYADSISVNNENGGISGSDGSSPPNYIQALCSHENNCFGPWSEMEWDDKDSYNWQRSYKTEDGWAFQINDPG